MDWQVAMRPGYLFAPPLTAGYPRPWSRGGSSAVRSPERSRTPVTLKNYQLRHVGPASGDEYEKRGKTACWIESIQVEFSIS